MPMDKSLLFYGAIYHRLFDPQLAETRQVTVDLIPGGSSVLDIGCGTGLLCFALREKKNCRVAGRVIIIDAAAPLPKNAGGTGIRLVEATFGRDHNPNFKEFLASAGIGGILKESALPISVEHRSVFWRNCREVFVISKPL